MLGLAFIAAGAYADPRKLATHVGAGRLRAFVRPTQFAKLIAYATNATHSTAMPT
jgi:hypothetical protein